MRSRLNTAVLVFANSPEVEEKNKSFFKACELFEDLSRRTLNQVRRSGLSYFHYDENRQRGKNFGERFVNAITEIFDSGYDFLITVGSDTPELKTRHILETAERMHRGEFVLGPSKDGGFYLMGLHRSQFSEDQMRQLPWQTGEVRARLIQQIRNKVKTVSYLPLLADIDSPGDIKSITEYLFNIPKSILIYFYRIMRIERPSDQVGMQSYALFQNTNYNKGSPFTRWSICS